MRENNLIINSEQKQSILDGLKQSIKITVDNFKRNEGTMTNKQSNEINNIYEIISRASTATLLRADLLNYATYQMKGKLLAFLPTVNDLRRDLRNLLDKQYSFQYVSILENGEIRQENISLKNQIDNLKNLILEGSAKQDQIILEQAKKIAAEEVKEFKAIVEERIICLQRANAQWEKKYEDLEKKYLKLNSDYLEEMSDKNKLEENEQLKIELEANCSEDEQPHSARFFQQG